MLKSELLFEHFRRELYELSSKAVCLSKLLAVGAEDGVVYNGVEFKSFL